MTRRPVQGWVLGCACTVAACASVSPVALPNGAPGLSVRCDQIETCYERALEACGGPYRVIDRVGSHAAMSPPQQRGISITVGGGGSISLIVQCAAIVDHAATVGQPEPGPVAPRVEDSVDACARGDVHACDAVCDLGNESYCKAATGLRRLSAQADRRRADAALGNVATPPCRVLGDQKPDDCVTLGQMFRNGRGVAQSDRVAVALFEKACTAGQPIACSLLGGMYQYGTGVSRDEARASKLFQSACEAGDALACFSLGLNQETGRGVSPDDWLASESYRKACEKGMLSACVRLGQMFEKGRGVTDNPQLAMSLYQKACGGGEAQGCTHLAWLYDQGKVVPRDIRRAYELYNFSCGAGVARACSGIGAMYLSGRDMRQDYRLAEQFFAKACEVERAGSADDGVECKALNNLRAIMRNVPRP